MSMESVELIFWQYVVPIALAYFIAWLVHLQAERIVRRMFGLSGYAPQGMRPTEERQRTLHDLLGSALSFAAFLVATIFTLGRFFDTTTLVWMIGLFSAAFGLGARPIISDFLTGLSFIVDDVVEVGEKIEVMGVEGVVEKISLRTMILRASSGEIYVVPNGEIRMIRNFSRGRFSAAEITVKIESQDLTRALEILEALGEESVALLPNLLEPWFITTTSSTVGQYAELTLATKARFGKAAEMRPRLLALVQERLASEGITLAN